MTKCNINQSSENLLISFVVVTVYCCQLFILSMDVFYRAERHPFENDNNENTKPTKGASNKKKLMVQTYRNVDIITTNEPLFITLNMYIVKLDDVTVLIDG